MDATRRKIRPQGGGGGLAAGAMLPPAPTVAAGHPRGARREIASDQASK